MKKLKLSAILAAMLAAFAFTACDNNQQQTGDDTPKDAIKVNYANGYYYGNFFSHYTDLIRMSFITDSITGEEKDGTTTYSGTGYFIYLDLLADVDRTNKDNVFPAAGNYKVSYDAVLDGDEGKVIVPTMLENGVVLPPFTDEYKNSFGCHVLRMEDGKVVSQASANEKSVITISGNAAKGKMVMKLTVVGEDETEQNINFVFEGAAKLQNEFIDGETAFDQENTAPTGDFTFTRMQGTTIGDMYGVGLDYYQVELNGANKEIAVFVYCVKEGEKPFGTFNLTHRVEANAAMTSTGAVEGENGTEISAPFVGIENATGFDKIWFPETGTITVADGKITYDIKSHKGHTLKGTYEGDVTFGSAQGVVAKKIVK